MSMNRIHNASNPNQGAYKKVLCVCSAGLLRSPTAARLLSMPPFNFNTRAVGLDSGHALIPIDGVHLHWADEIIVMDSEMKSNVGYLLEQCGLEAKKPFLHNISIPDMYEFRHVALECMLDEKLRELFKIPAPREFEPVENADTQEC